MGLEQLHELRAFRRGQLAIHHRPDECGRSFGQIRDHIHARQIDGDDSVAGRRQMAIDAGFEGPGGASLWEQVNRGGTPHWTAGVLARTVMQAASAG